MAYDWVGKRVRVVRGRKVPIGTEGTVFWKGMGRAYGYSRIIPMRVRMKTDAGETIWINAGNVEQVEQNQVDGLVRNWELEAV